MNVRVVLCAASAALILAACGGGGDNNAPPGGGGSGGVLPAQTFDMNAAIGAVLSQGADFPIMRGSLSGVDFGAAVTYRSAADAPFGGVTSRRSVRTITMSSSVAPSETSEDTLFFTLAPTRMTGYIGQDGLTARLEVTGDLPTAGYVGQSGPYLHATGYAADNQTVLGENWVTWSLEPDDGSTALACLSWATEDSQVYTKDCFRIDSAGRVSGATMTMYYDFGTIEFR